MSRSLGDRLRAVRRIARWEVSRSAGTLDRRTVGVALVALVLAGGVASAGVVTGGVALDRDIYRVGVDADSPYYGPVVASPALDPRPADVSRMDGMDLFIGDGYIAADDSQKSKAALAELNDAVRRYNTRTMAAEENRTAAFPVVVSLEYASRTSPLPAGTGSTSGESSDADGVASGGSDGTSGVGDGESGAATDGASGGSTASGSTDSVPPGSGSDDSLSIPSLGGVNPFASASTGSPADIRPPFPFASLVLAFAFLVPMNFVVQAYGGTMLNERINRRGELLLVAPVSPGDIVLGKTLPYLAVLVGLTAAIALAVGGGFVSVAAILPIGLVFLGATFVGAMFARSFKELTFVTVAVSVFLTSYTFVPAIFTQVTPVALISPLTLVVRDLGAQSVSLGEYLFSTGPFFLCGVALFALGAGVYREEDMFTQRSVPLKFLDALDARVSRPRDVAVVSAVSIPFVFAAELLAIAVLFVLPVAVTVPTMLLLVALIEEAAKSLHVFAAFEKSRFERTLPTALRLGALSGLGFFVGEKFTAVAQLIGLQRLELGRTLLAPAGVDAGALAGTGAGAGAASGAAGLLLALALLVAPLALHAVTAGISAVGASRGKRPYAAAFLVAVAVHAAYNYAVVSVLG
ncbi:PrsW family intramembrane metalloprotease [Halogeometricum sp. S1BR25-6]|uniref:PrsW family intramembrane metalloprotease n=1 Tax=Halogeometricum salsisoli TaxID=2950536 RepID=A0ABU2GD90_9EURY|nr:PrsW family intramembrane metalloprotease [Halogeometricum sp. S1BR25-6]MDS0298762.1 PrsW family intramembrane metalloprotease [Halogeometricum sp. S1BR25-6]